MKQKIFWLWPFLFIINCTNPDPEAILWLKTDANPQMQKQGWLKEYKTVDEKHLLIIAFGKDYNKEFLGISCGEIDSENIYTVCAEITNNKITNLAGNNKFPLELRKKLTSTKYLKNLPQKIQRMLKIVFKNNCLPNYQIMEKLTILKNHTLNLGYNPKLRQGPGGC